MFGIVKSGYTYRFAKCEFLFLRISSIHSSEEIEDGENYLAEDEHGVLHETYPNLSSRPGEPTPIVGNRKLYRINDQDECPSIDIEFKTINNTGDKVIAVASYYTLGLTKEITITKAEAAKYATPNLKKAMEDNKSNNAITTFMEHLARAKARNIITAMAFEIYASKLCNQII